MKLRYTFFFLSFATCVYDGIAEFQHEIYAEIGKPFSLVYSSNTNRSIDFCHWAPIKTPSFLQLSALSKDSDEELSNGKCTLTMPKAMQIHFGVWKCIVVFLSNEHEDNHEEYFVNVLKSKALQSLPEVIGIIQDETKTISCCIRGITENYSDQIKVNLMKNQEILRHGFVRNDTNDPFCYTWNHIYFAWVDYRKNLRCDFGNLAFDSELIVEDMQVSNSGSLQLNILSSPRVLSSSGVYREDKSFLNSPAANIASKSEYTIEFISNPIPLISTVTLVSEGVEIDRKKTLSKNSVRISHEGNRGTVIFEPDEKIIQMVKSTQLKKFICVLLKNNIGSEKVCFYVEYIESKTGSLEISANTVAPITVVSSYIKTSTQLPTTTVSNEDVKSTLHHYLDSSTIQVDFKETEFVQQVLTQNFTSTSIDTSSTEKFIHFTPVQTEVTSTTENNPTLSTTENNPTIFTTEFELNEGFFAENSSLNYTPFPETNVIVESPSSRQPIVLTQSRSLNLGNCDIFQVRKIPIKFSADPFTNTTVTWKLRTGSDNYTDVDRSKFQIKQLKVGVWETTLMIDQCNTTENVPNSKIYYALYLENVHGRDGLRLSLDKAPLSTNSSPRSSTTISVLNIIIPSVIAGILLILLIIVFVIKDDSMLCLSRRRRMSFSVNQQNRNIL